MTRKDYHDGTGCVILVADGPQHIVIVQVPEGRPLIQLGDGDERIIINKTRRIIL